MPCRACRAVRTVLAQPYTSRTCSRRTLARGGPAAAHPRRTNVGAWPPGIGYSRRFCLYGLYSMGSTQYECRTAAAHQLGVRRRDLAVEQLERACGMLERLQPPRHSVASGLSCRMDRTCNMAQRARATASMLLVGLCCVRTSGSAVDWLARLSSQNESERERKETPCLLVPTKVGESSAQIQMRACNRAHVSTYTCAFSSIGGASRKAHARSRGCTLSRMHALADARSLSLSPPEDRSSIRLALQS
jgi:hypothetical protein